MKMRGLILSLVLLVPSYALAEDLYFGESVAGSANGSSCANQLSAANFNNASFWGVGAGKISAGDTAHLCGTITTNLTAAGSGSAGNVVTILFETAAVLSPSACGSSGCLNLTSKSYMVVDGGTACGWVAMVNVDCNGRIYNTTVRPAGDNYGVVALSCVSCEFRNVRYGPFYTRTANDGNNPSGNSRVIFTSGIAGSDPFLVHHNSFEHAASSVVFIPGASTAGLAIYNNYFHEVNSSVDISNNNDGIVLAATVHDNHIGGTGNWDEPGCVAGHHNSLHAFGILGGNGGYNSGVKFYNNYVDGYWGSCSTAELFFESNETGGNRNLQVYNNVFAATYTVMNPLVAVNADIGTMEFYNNTLIGTYQSNDICFQAGTRTAALAPGSAVLYAKNNLYINCQTPSSMQDLPGYANVDYNMNVGPSPNPWHKRDLFVDTWYSTFAAWKAYCGCEANGIYNASATYANLNSDGSPKATSPTILTGVNLASLGITALNSTINGVQRPTSGSWDMGAYIYGSGSLGSSGSSRTLASTRAPRTIFNPATTRNPIGSARTAIQ